MASRSQRVLCALLRPNIRSRQQRNTLYTPVRHYAQRPQEVPWVIRQIPNIFLGLGIASMATTWGAYQLGLRDGALEGPASKNSTTPLSAIGKLEHKTSKGSIESVRRELVALLGPSGVDTSPGNLRNHSSTEWSRSPTDRAPDLIVYPSYTEDVSGIMKICHKRQIPVTAFSGGTSLDGALAATRGGVTIDFQRMNKIKAVHERDFDAVVQPGVCWTDLNEELKPLGLFFPVDPAPSAQIGGMIGTGCSGTNAYRYGPMKEWVLGLTVVLADGTIVKTRHRPRKSTAGYDLTRLVIGSSGTLALVTEATIKLTALPQNVHTAVVPFPTLHAAVDAATSIIERGLPLAAIELLDEKLMQGVNAGGFTARTWAEKPTLFLKFSDASPRVVQDQISTVRALTKSSGALAFEADGSPAGVDALWSARKDALFSLLAMKKQPEDKFLSSDVAVPISRMADLINEMNGRAERSGLHSSTIGHVGDGNFHFSVLYGEAEREAAERLIRESQELAVRMEGTVTGEHGVGLALRDVLQQEVGEAGVDLMRKVKVALDPLCLLNCDKIVRMEKGVGH